MTTTQIILTGGLTVLGIVLGALFNGLFGMFKGRADVASLYTDLAKETAIHNREMKAAIEKLTDSVDSIVPILERIALRYPGDPDALLLVDRSASLRVVNSAARHAI